MGQQVDADAQLAHLRRGLVDDGLVAQGMQGKRRAQTADTAADDRNVHWSHLARAQIGKGEGRSIGDQLCQDRRIVGHQPGARLRCGARCVARDALAVEVLGLPGEAQPPVVAEAGVTACQRAGMGGEVGDAVGAHQLRMEVQHDRGLDQAAVDAVGQLVGVDEAVRRRPAQIARPHHQHGVACPQALGDDVDDLRLAAVRVEDDELAQAGTRQRGADLRPACDQGLGLVAQRAFVVAMLDAVADRLGRQDQDGRVDVERGKGCGDDPVGNHAVGAQRQVGAVLFDRADRQHGDRRPAIQSRDIAGGQVVPGADVRHRRCLARRVRWLNRGRVCPACPG